MILNFLVLVLIFLSIIGHAILVKKLISNKVKIIFNNEDIFLGVFNLTFISIIINFFFPLKYFTELFLFGGVVLFFFLKKKIKFNFSYKILFMIIFFFTLLILANPLVGDSSFYHLQIIKWQHEYKIIFGISNIEIRFGMNSIWHTFLALYSLNYAKLNTIYLMNLIPIIVLVNQLFILKKKEYFFISSKFLISVVLFLLIYSFIHPTYNGILFNFLGSPEVDIVAMIFFIFAFYFFLKFIEKPHINFFNYLIMFSIFSFLIKVSYISSVFFIFILCLFYRRFFFKNYSIIGISVLFVSLWVLKNFINTGCLVFPADISCLNIFWAANLSDVIYHKNEVSSFARSIPFYDFGNFDFYLRTYNWVTRWLYNYLFKASFFIILFYIFLISVLNITYIKFIRLKKNFNSKFQININLIIFVVILFFFSLLIWFRAPDLRFNYANFICFSLFFFAISISCYDQILIKYFKFIKYFTLLFFILIIIKNYQYLIFKETSNFEVNRQFNYNDFIFSHQLGNFNFYYPKTDCYDFKDVCVYKDKSQLKLNISRTYIFFIN